MSAPTSTYRLQISPEFTLDQARQVLGYLADLGVGAVYLSPLLTAAPGSPHGYDWVDWREVDPQRGGEQAWRRFRQDARAAGLGIVIDIVPNHMGIEPAWANPAFWDVLRLGRDSRYADWFDIEWQLGPIRLPLLAEPGTLADLRVHGRGDAAELRLGDLRLPIAPGTWTPDPLQLHEAQHYRLVDWRSAAHTLSYRRFFAINSLAGLRIEDEAVAEPVHQRVRGWIAEGVTGLRVDHPDGLTDPGGYLDRLRGWAPQAWLVVEKILQPGEALPHWPVQGSTGYDAMLAVDQVFVDPAGEPGLTKQWQTFSGDTRDLAAYELAAKREVVEGLFGPEVGRLVRVLALPCPEAEVAAALRSIAVHFPVYRSYLPDGAEHLARAVQAARAEGTDPELLDQLAGRLAEPGSAAAQRFQQLTTAVTAKGVEDTAFYRYNRLVGLNEVGGDPGTIGWTPERFHRAMAERQRVAPESMTTLATHDTKRGPDIRARLAVLAEPAILTGPWAAFLEAFTRHTGRTCPATSMLLAQTLAGTGPIDRRRLREYTTKAMREAALETRWAAPDERAEAAAFAAVDAAFDDPRISGPWQQLLAAVEAPGRSNSLGRTLVQLAMPGVPDTYQGTEVWDDSLVDPDNRRPVDFAALGRLAGQVGDQAPPLGADGAAKWWLVRSLLRARRDHPEWFTDYRPVYAEGSRADHLLAFDRGGVICCATRLPVGLDRAGGWQDTTLQLPDARRDLLTGAVHPAGGVPLGQLLASYPVAALVALP